MELRYRIVDVFTEVALAGNALAVFPDAAGLEDGLMQRIARELNLAETVFVVPSTRADCAVRLRIFTPTREMRFAGHPTVGSGFVLLDEGVVAGDCVVEEGVGPVPIRMEHGERPMFWLTTPPISWGPVMERSIAVQVLGLRDEDLLDPAPQLVTAGNPTIFVALRDRAAVDRASLDLNGLKWLRGGYPEPVCVFVFAPTEEGAYSRMFAPEYGIAEDPATGSSTGPLAAYMRRHGLVAKDRFVSEQGTQMGRRSLLHVAITDDVIEVGGHVVPVMRGVMELG